MGADVRMSEGSVTVEASFVSIFCVLLIFSVIVFSMCLRSRVTATANVRIEIENEFSNIMTERTSETTVKKEKTYDGVRLWPDAIFSYEESAEKTFLRGPDTLYLARIGKAVFD